MPKVTLNPNPHHHREKRMRQHIREELRAVEDRTALVRKREAIVEQEKQQLMKQVAYHNGLGYKH